MFWDALKWSYESAEHAKLKAGPQAVLNALAYSMHPTSKECYPSVARLSALTHQGKSTVARNLDILVKERLITIVHDKTKHDTNCYRLNYKIIPKKGKKGKDADAAAATLSAECARTNAECVDTHISDEHPISGEGTLSKQENQTLKTENTPLSNRDANKTNTNNINSIYISTSISNQVKGGDALSSQKSSKNLTAPEGFFDARLKHRYVEDSSDCCGYDKALKVVDEAYPMWFIPTGDKEKDDSNKAAREILAKALALFPCPTVEDVKGIGSLIKHQVDWIALEETTENVRDRVDICDRIHDMRKYFRKSLLSNIIDKRGDVEWSDK